MARQSLVDEQIDRSGPVLSGPLSQPSDPRSNDAHAVENGVDDGHPAPITRSTGIADVWARFSAGRPEEASNG